jgi:hypothetical protein
MGKLRVEFAGKGKAEHFDKLSLVLDGEPAAEMDLWRIDPAGGTPERLTKQDTDIAYPTPVDSRTVLYVARDGDGSGPWLWAFDLKRKRSRRVSFGLEQYTSVAATTDGRKLVATIGNPKASLWRVPILDRLSEERDVKPFTVPAVRALAPRFAGASLFYLSSLGTSEGLWRYRDAPSVIASESLWLARLEHNL